MLYEIFNSVGPVASIRVCRDSVTRKSLGYAYVNFHSVQDAERALDTLNYSSIKGRSCRIMWTQRDPSMRKSGAGNIYVKNLDKNIDNKALYDTFSLFGNILSCKVASDLSGKSHGYGFVHYETEEAAKQAIERVNGMQIGEKTVEVTAFEKRGDRVRPEVTNFTNVYCKTMPAEWDEEKIKEEFGKFGTITSMCIREDKKGRKMAFVNFETTESAQAAVAELHGKEVRSEEQIAKLKEDLKEEFKEDVGKLFVQRAQTKLERSAELRDKFPAASRPDSKPQGVNLYVKNLDEGTDEASLRALFESFGQITSVAAPLDDKGKCKGFGFVCFQSPDEATKAVTEMHLKVVKGKPLYVGLAEKREARQERLRQRYSPGGGDKGGAKGGAKGFGGKGGMQGGMGGGMMGGMQGGMGGGMGMMGKGGQQMGMGMGMPQMGMMGMMPQQAQAMMMAGKGGMMNPMGARGPMPGGPQMMGMQQMMGMRPGMPNMMMGGKGGMPQMGMTGMGGMGMMPGMMPGAMRPGMMPQQMPRPAAAPPAQAQGGAGGPLSASALAAAPPSVQKQMIGEKLFPIRYQPELAGKITGMMLEMDNSELLILLESEQQMKGKVDEALRVLGSNK
ncbi:unnamed protein product [Prorocentrum cordatum]|uniref:Polyadenylate-binding protein n=1 Tax=Prorocentrum cordatum TaxID=2364126 RepID=A0ABN9Y406_9DINO|nr:unnamed protein product [Polarella glacialis]